MPSDQRAHDQGILDSFGGCLMVRPAAAWHTEAFPISNERNCSSSYPRPRVRNGLLRDAGDICLFW
jgi:hypothetical protein